MSWACDRRPPQTRTDGDASGAASASLQLPALAPIPAHLLDRDLGFTFLAGFGNSALIGNRLTLRILP